MNEQRPNKKTSQPFLREDDDAPSVGGRRKTKSPRTSRGEPVLGDNDFLEPQGNPWMWVGFLAVPLIVLAFAYVQGFLFGGNGNEAGPDNAAPQSVQEQSLTPDQIQRIKRRDSVYQRRLDRMER